MLLDLIDRYVFNRVRSRRRTATRPPAAQLNYADLNVPAIRAIVAYIEHNTGSWNQRTWYSTNVGRPVMCFGGLAMHLAGRSPSYHAEQANAGRTAQDLLGLTDDQAMALFYYTFDPATGAHPTVAAFKQRITAVTGIVFEPQEPGRG